MLLTRDNVLKYVRVQKYVTPTHVAKEFDVTTTIASAALSELVKDLSIKLTHIKFGTTPYYYDPLQKECLIEICEKTFSGNELNLFNKFKEQQILSRNSLSIPEQVILSKLQDIYYELSIENNSKEYIFYIWYLRDKNETLQQIKTAFSGNSNTTSNQKKSPPQKEESKKKEEQVQTPKKASNPFENIYKNSSQNFLEKSKEENKPEIKSEESNGNENSSVDSYLNKHRFTIIEKEKHHLGNKYVTSLIVNSHPMLIDCLSIENKKIQLKDIMEFYTSSMRPKYILYSTLPKKIEQVLQELDNCFLIKL